MASYATTTELQTRFGTTSEAVEELSRLTDSFPTVDTAVLTDALEQAEGHINSRIGKRYATPVVVTGNTELTALLKRQTLDLAEVFLLERGDRVSEVKERQRDRVLEWATKVAIGEFILSGAVTPPSTASRAPLGSWSGSDRDLSDVPTRIFSRETLSAL